MDKHVSKKSLQETRPSDDLAYWLKKTTAERLAAVEFLREQIYEHATPRLQRTARIIQRTPS